MPDAALLRTLEGRSRTYSPEKFGFMVRGFLTSLGRPLWAVHPTRQVHRHEPALLNVPKATQIAQIALVDADKNKERLVRRQPRSPFVFLFGAASISELSEISVCLFESATEPASYESAERDQHQCRTERNGNRPAFAPDELAQHVREKDVVTGIQVLRYVRAVHPEEREREHTVPFLDHPVPSGRWFHEKRELEEVPLVHLILSVPRRELELPWRERTGHARSA